MASLTKESVNYREATDKERCQNCVMSHFPADQINGTCDLVIGAIFPFAVCDRWEAVT